MREGILSLWVILLYVMRRAGTLSFEEKMYILELIGYISRRVAHVDGATLLEEVTRYQPSRDDRSRVPSLASKTPECTLHP